MNEIDKTLYGLKIGQIGIVYDIKCDGKAKRRLQDIGFTKGAKVFCAFKSPFGEPTAYRVKDTTIALRDEQSKNIIIECKGEDILWD